MEKIVMMSIQKMSFENFEKGEQDILFGGAGENTFVLISSFERHLLLKVNRINILT